MTNTKALDERAWRNQELLWADIEINKAQDEDIDVDWLRIYRQDLRKYPERTGFPNCDRPERPKS